MDIYLPIAEMSLDLFVLLGLGAGIGFLSGVFGVGGGFLLTPMLIFIGVPPAIAVASSANQLVGASLSGVIAHWRRRNVDFKIGFILMAAGRARVRGAQPERRARPRRRVRPGAADDLCAGAADRGGARHVLVADHLCRGERHLPPGLY